MGPSATSWPGLDFLTGLRRDRRVITRRAAAFGSGGLERCVIGQPRAVFSALLLIVGSQVALAALLFGTAAIDRPRVLLLIARRQRRRDPIVELREHQRRLSSLQAAAERSLESAHR